MRARITGYVAIAAFVTTVLWLILLIASQVAAGPLDNFVQVIQYIREHSSLFTLTYLNAALTVLTTTALFGGLYVITRPISPQLAAMGLCFVPVYAVLNLVVYLSQVSVVPYLLALRVVASLSPEFGALLGMFIQMWPSSPAAFFNNLAYAILGIPSILFGLLLVNRHRRFRAAGSLLALNGVACLAGFIGILAGASWLRSGSLVGGVLYLLASPLLAANLLRQPRGVE